MGGTLILQQGKLKENDLEQDNSMKNQSYSPSKKIREKNSIYTFS